MKATGIVRRIDDLGRVVVPKEIRKVLKIREGDPLEIYTESSGEIILKKYSPIGDMSRVAEEFTETVSITLGTTVAVSDTEQYIASAGKNKKQFDHFKINSELDEIIQAQNEYKTDEKIVVPIVAQGDPVGSITVMASEGESLSESACCAARIGAKFLARQILN